jgi:hypothetical protein
LLDSFGRPEASRDVNGASRVVRETADTLCSVVADVIGISEFGTGKTEFGTGKTEFSFPATKAWQQAATNSTGKILWKEKQIISSHYLNWDQDSLEYMYTREK